MSALETEQAPRYCQRCGGTLIEGWEEDHQRLVCSGCGRITYRNPVPAAGCLVEDQGRVLLVRRGIDPYKGTWALPSGFVEYDESVQDAALRETLEETGLRVHLDDIQGVYSYFDDPRQNGIVVLYRAHPVEGVLKAGDDAEEARYFSRSELPAEQEIGFASHRDALHRWRAESPNLAATAPSVAELDASADKYERYLRTGRGWLRQESAYRNLLELVPWLAENSTASAAGRRVLDVGGGGGGLAVRLAALGHPVTLLDPSPRMLELAQGRIAELPIALRDRVTTTLGTIEDLETLVPASFDLVVCHHVLEYVADAAHAVGALSARLRPGGILSLLCTNRLAEPLRLMQVSPRPPAVGQALDTRSFPTDTFGGRRVQYSPSELRSMFRQAGLEVLHERGIIPLTGSAANAEIRAGDEAEWLQLEVRTGRQQEYVGTARYVQLLATRTQRQLGEQA